MARTRVSAPSVPGLGVVGAAAVGIAAVRRLFYFFMFFWYRTPTAFSVALRRSSAPSSPARPPRTLASPPPHPRPRHRPSRVRRVRPLRSHRAATSAAYHGLCRGRSTRSACVPRHGLVPRRHVARQHRDILQARLGAGRPDEHEALGRGGRVRLGAVMPSAAAAAAGGAAGAAAAGAAGGAAGAGAATAAAATTAAAAAEPAPSPPSSRPRPSPRTLAPRCALPPRTPRALRCGARPRSAPAPQRAGRWAASAASPTPCAGRPPTRPAPAWGSCPETCGGRQS